jgi:hypothetical protein
MKPEHSTAKKKAFSILLLLITSIVTQAQVNDLDKQKGKFKDYESFLLNEPFVTNFSIDTAIRTTGAWRGTYSFIPENSSLVDLWGFSDGKNCYYQFGDDFFKIYKEGDNYVVYAYAAPDMSDLSMAAYTGGLVGTMVYSGVANNEAKKSVQKYYIDPYTGELTSSKELLDFYKVTERYSTLIIYTGDSENNEPIRFSLDDSISYSLSPNSIVELILPLKLTPYVLSMDMDTASEKQFYLNVNEKTYFRGLRLKNTNGQIHFQKVNPETASFEAARSRRLQERRERRN